MLAHEIYEDQLSIKHFIDLYLRNKLYFPFNYIGQPFNRCVLITLNSITDLPAKEPNQTLRLRATLYNQEYNAFLGRTYVSIAFNINPKTLSTMPSFKEIMLVTLFATQSYKIIIELSIEKEGEEKGIGYIVIDASQENGKKKVYCFKGSPRELITNNGAMSDFSQISVAYEFSSYQKPNPIYVRLLPTDTIIGTNDVLPGLKTQQFLGDMEKPMLQPYSTVVVTNIMLKNPSNLVPLLLKSIELECEDIQNRKKEIIESSIKDISLHIDCNNSWKSIISTHSLSLFTTGSSEYVGTGKIIISNTFIGNNIGYIISLHCTGMLLISYL